MIPFPLPDLTHLPSFWYGMTLVAALTATAKAATLKHACRTLSPEVALWGLSSFGAIALWVTVFFVGVPMPNKTFLLAWILVLPISLGAQVLNARALSVSDLSIVSPLVATSPVYLLVLGPLFAEDRLSIQGVLGVLLVVGGTYVLYVGKDAVGWAGPLKAVWRDKGARMALVAALLMATGNLFDKWGILSGGSPLLWSTFIATSWAVVLTPRAVLSFDASSWRKGPWKMIAVFGLLGGLGGLIHSSCLAHLPVTYVVGLKRTSVLVSVAAGWWLFGESGFKKRLFAASMVVLGGLLIVMS